MEDGIDDGVDVKYEGRRERQCEPLASLGNQIPGLLAEHRWIHSKIRDRKPVEGLGHQCFPPWRNGKIFHCIEEMKFELISLYVYQLTTQFSV